MNILKYIPKLGSHLKEKNDGKKKAKPLSCIPVFIFDLNLE